MTAMKPPRSKKEERHAAYWRANLRLVAVLMGLGFFVTFVIIFFANSLASLRLFGWPVPFYMAAQGSVLVYVLIVWYYARRMQQIDRKFSAERDS